MKATHLIAIAGACMALCACGGGDSGVSSTVPAPPPSMTPPPPPPSMSLTAEDVLAKARVQSETDDPFAVDGGAVMVTPAGDETSDPVGVNN